MRAVDIEKLFVNSTYSIRDVMDTINSGVKGIALLVDSHRCLLETVTDGDVRRGILGGLGLDSNVDELLKFKVRSLYPKPVSAHFKSSKKELLGLINSLSIRQIPLVDDNNYVVDLVGIDDLVSNSSLGCKKVLNLHGVVMAGGFGKRLRPYTDNVPKPMLPVGDKPMLQYIVEQLREAGIMRLNISTFFHPEVIEDYFGDGKEYGVDIKYVNEKEPLGTAGAIGLLDEKEKEQPLLVINGDIMTDVNFRAMLEFHNDNNADLTVGIREYEMEVPYGVLECEGELVKSLKEKPKHTFFVNAGIYLLSRSVHEFIIPGDRMDMTDLIERLIKREMRVVSFPIMEYWLDIGQHSDYSKVQEYVEKINR